MNNSISSSIKEQMLLLAKNRKAKVCLDGVFKKEGQYFWCIYIKQYSSQRYAVTVELKPWKYDELLFSITHPGENLKFSDKLRWNGFSAMSMFIIKKTYYPWPAKNDAGEITTVMIADWCKNIFNESMCILDSFCEKIKEEYGELDNFHIAHAESNKLLAAFACIAQGDFQTAERFLLEAREDNLVFNRSFGSYSRDLRDVLLDYCEVSMAGKEWTKELVVNGLKV